jgi:hypothetical protein
LAVAILPLATLHAQQVVTYTLAPSAFTFAMVIKETAPGTFERNPVGGAFKTPRVPTDFNFWETGRIVNGSIPDPASENSEFVAKVVSKRYGNRELITELVQNGDIAGPIAGWSLVYIYDGDPTEQEFLEPTLVARKRGQRDRELDIIDYDFSGGASAYNYLGATTFRNGVPNVSTVRGRYNFEYAASIGFAFGDLTANLGGLEIGSGSLFSYYPDPTDRSVADAFSVPGAIRYTNLVGATTGDGFEVEDDEFFEFGSLVTGTASIGASRVITMRTTMN